MSQNIIDTGQAANDGTGEPLRQAFTEINNNFSQIWSSGPVNSNVQITNSIAGNGQEIGQYIAEKTQLDTRVSVLGHIQRGGSPSVIDRVRASRRRNGSL